MNKFVVKKILFVIAIIGLCNTGLCNNGTTEEEQSIVSLTINKTKMLERTNQSGSEKMYESAKYPLSFLVLHYAVTTTMGQTINVYYSGGVSAHFTVDKDGTIYKHIDDGNVAYHAGPSFWHGKYSLNWYSIGIEQINTGWDVNNPRWKELLSFKEADGKEWEIWSETQIESVVKLVKSLSEQHNIKPWNIIGHSDCSCGRKVDPGPLFPWKKLHDEYGVGFWPDEDMTITKEQANELTNSDYLHLLHAFGYPVKNFTSSSVENIEELKDIWTDAKVVEKMKQMEEMSNKLTSAKTISAFQYHYLQDKFEKDPAYRAGELDNDTQFMILRCVKSIIKYADKGDYSLRMLEKMYESGLSAEAKKMLESFNQNGRLNLKTEGNISMYHERDKKEL